MALTPRFNRVAALKREFFDREAVFAQFDDVLGEVSPQVRLFNVYGVGGVGKTRVCKELSDKAARNSLVATIDLNIPALRQRSGTSHQVYRMPWPGDPRVNIQDDHGKAKPYQVRQVLIAIERLEAQR
jgi:hypothetical protein